MQSPFQAWVSRFAAMLAALCAPPTFVALFGGSDLDLPFARVTWYDTAGPALAFAVAMVAALLQPRASKARAAARIVTALRFGALASLALATWAAALGGFAADGFSARHALSPAALAAIALAIAFAIARGAVRTPLAPALVALLVGSIATALALHADRLDLRERIAAASGAARGGADIVFIVVDTLRADAVGFARRDAPEAPTPVTPTLDALAADSVVFDAAFSQAPWTLPSMMSLVTSRYASTLHPSWRGAWPTRVPLEAEPSVLADALRDAGYHTAGFVKNPMLAKGTGFERGYDVYEWVGGDDADGHSARQLVDAALRWANEFSRARKCSRDSRGDRAGAPFFLAIHFMDPHAHYRPPHDFWSEDTRRYSGNFDGHSSTLKRMTRAPAVAAAADIEQMRRLYRDEVRYVDSQLGRLLHSLEELGLVDARTVIVATADHGEQFGEHGGFEHRDVYIENVHVPLVMRVPGQSAHRVAEPIGLIDVVPTLLDWLGLPELVGAQGRSRLASLRGESMPGAPVVTEFGAALRATSGSQVVVRSEDGSFEFYDRARDSLEQRDLAGPAASGFEPLRRALETHEARIPAADGVAAELPPEMPDRKRLEALGYTD